jgi:predicted MFS family arabinose efflux permease
MVETPSGSDRSLRATVTLLGLAGFLSGCALRICDGLLPRLAADFGTTAGRAGDVVLAFSVAYGLAQLLFGPLGDRYGKPRMVCIATFGCGLAALACALAPGWAALVVLRTAWGLCAAGLIPLSLAWVGDAVPYERRQATLAQLLLGILSGMTAGQVAGGWFADTAPGWRGAFASLGVGYLAVGLLVAVRLRAMSTAAPAAATAGAASGGMGARYAEVLRAPRAPAVLAAAAAEGVLLLGVLAYLPAALHLRHGVSLSAASTAAAGYALGGLAYTVLAHRVVPALGERRMLVGGTALAGVSLAAILAAPGLASTFVLVALLGFGTYLFHSTLQANATQMAPRVRGTAVACFAFCLFNGQALGAWLAGRVYDHLGPVPLFLAPAVLLPVVGLLAARRLAQA